MAQVIKFASAIDGAEFDTLAEQLSYDAGLRNAAQIEAFLDLEYPKPAPGVKGGASRGIVKKALAAWIAFNTPAPVDLGELLSVATPHEEPTI